MGFFFYDRQYINADRIVRVENQSDLFTIHWMDEQNQGRTILLRADQWELMKREIGITDEP